MTPTAYGAIAVVLAAAVSGLVTWLIAKRNKSGKIITSEANTLWDEGTLMRKELRQEVGTLHNEVGSLKAQLSEAITAVTDLNREIKASRAETERAREETRQSRAETRVLMAQIDELSVTQKELHGEVKTNNALTIAALADNAETRRILLVPKDERTPVEFEHLRRAGERQPEGEHPPISDSDLPDGEAMIESEPLDE